MGTSWKKKSVVRVPDFLGKNMFHGTMIWNLSKAVYFAHLITKVKICCLVLSFHFSTKHINQDIYSSGTTLFSVHFPFVRLWKLLPCSLQLFLRLLISSHNSFHNRHLSHAAIGRINSPPPLRGSSCEFTLEEPLQITGQSTAGQWQLRPNGISQDALLNNENKGSADFSGERPDKLRYCAQPVMASCFHASVSPLLKITKQWFSTILPG
jgi:hypothetical protein